LSEKNERESSEEIAPLSLPAAVRGRENDKRVFSYDLLFYT